MPQFEIINPENIIRAEKDTTNSRTTFYVASAATGTIEPEFDSTIMITYASAGAALTINSDSAKQGMAIEIFSNSAKAHVITLATGATFIGGADNTCTMTAATGNRVRMTFYNDIWYVIDSVNCTLSTVA